MPIDKEISASSTKKPIGTRTRASIGKRTIGTLRLSALWENAMPDLSALDEKPPDSVHKWRKEVIQGGKYWQWRVGSADSRKARYGGTFRTLSENRKAQYERNKKAKHTKAKRRVAVSV